MERTRVFKTSEDKRRWQLLEKPNIRRCSRNQHISLNNHLIIPYYVLLLLLILLFFEFYSILFLHQVIKVLEELEELGSESIVEKYKGEL